MNRHPLQVVCLMDGQFPMTIVIRRDEHIPNTWHLLHWFTDEAEAYAWVAEREALEHR